MPKTLLPLILILLSCYTQPTLANTINELYAITVNDTKQWLYIRGDSIEKPILLFIHGGPGKPDMWAEYYQKSLEKDFIVVRWDQRGAGKSYDQTIPEETMTLNQLQLDFSVVAQHLGKKFGKNKLFILGHSFGSTLGTLIAQRYPERLHAYIGTGQGVSLARAIENTYAFLLKTAHRYQETAALAELTSIGPPPYPVDKKLIKKFETIFKWLLIFGGEVYGQSDYSSILSKVQYSQAYSDEEFSDKFPQGMFFSFNHLIEETLEVDLASVATTFEIPYFVLQGRHDQNTGATEALAYFNQIDAPIKGWVWFEKSAHSPPYEETEKFTQTLISIKNLVLSIN